MRKTLRSMMLPMVLVLALLGAGSAWAGGFWLAVERPAATAGSSDAVLVVRALGCHEPANATVVGRAEGWVAGQRQSIPLQLTRTAPGVYSVRREWPAQGSWVLTLSGTHQGRQTTTLIHLDADGAIPADLASGGGDRSVESFPRALSGPEIDAALRS